MEQKYYITHHGVKGQKWGVRRYQHKDGSLTLMGRRRIKKTEKEEAAKAKQKAQEEREKETTEQRRARLLKSANAKELYENRNLLTTQEINERLTRIDTERRLGEVAAKGEKSRFDKLTERMDKIVKVGTKVNDMYKLTESGAGKALKEAIFGKKDDDENDARNLLGKPLDKLSSKQLGNLKDYLEKQSSVKKLLKGDDDDDARNLLGKDISKMSSKQLGNLKDYLEKQSSVTKLLKGDNSIDYNDLMTKKVEDLSNDEVAKYAQLLENIGKINNNRKSKT